MNTRSGKRRALRVVGLTAVVAVAAVLLGSAVASAQPRPERGPWERLDLSKEQREKVRDIVKEHRDDSRAALHKKLATVLTDDQLAQLEKMDGRRGGKGMWDNRPGRPGRPGRREMLTPGRGHNRGGRNCDHGAHKHGGRAMRRGGGDEKGGCGHGPRMGGAREERGERMVNRLAMALDLTGAQTEQIAKIVEEHHAQFKDFDCSELSSEDRQKTRDAHRMLLANRVKEVLSDEQQEKYDEFLKTMPGKGRACKGKCR